MPEPGPGKVRIKVEACGICHSDTFTVEGQIPGNAKALSALIDGLGVDGKLLVAGVFDRAERSHAATIDRQASFGGRMAVRPVVDSEDIMRFSVLEPMIETFPLTEAAKGYQRMMSGDARFLATAYSAGAGTARGCCVWSGPANLRTTT